MAKKKPKPKVSREVLLELARNLRKKIKKRPSSAALARIIAMIGRFEKKVDPIRKIEHYGGYFKYASFPAVREKLDTDTFDKMRLGWLVNAVGAALKNKSKTST